MAREERVERKKETGTNKSRKENYRVTSPVETD